MNKISFKKRTVCAVLVSVICILLASSFIFHTVAEASVLTYSLQGASFGNYINDDGTISSNGLDRSLIDNYSVTAQNQYVLSGNYDSFGTPFPQFTDSSYTTGFAYTGFDDVVYVVCNGSSSTGTVTATFYSLTSVFTRDVMAGSSYLFSDECYFVRIDDKFYIYDYDGNLLITLADSSYSRYCYGLYTFENKIFVCRGIKTSSSSTTSLRFYVYDGDTYSQLYYKAVANLGGTAKQRSCVFLDGSIYLLAGGNVWVFDCSNYALSQSYSVTGDIISSDRKHIYVFSGSTVYVHDFDFSLIKSYSLSLSVSASSYVATAPYLYDSFFVLQYDSGYYNFIPLSKSNQYYTDFSAHFVDSFAPSKWINFSCRPSTDGTVVGGDAVSIKLDYALSDDYLATVNTYGVKVSGCTMLASLDDLSTGTGYYGLPPLVVKVNGSVVPRITKQYESVEKVGDVYLYAFSAFCDFQGSTKINSLEIYMNCYVPEQLSRHSFSLPVSDLDLYLEPLGGGTGGGESSGGSSGGESSGDDGLTDIYTVSYASDGSTVATKVDSIDLASAESLRIYLGDWTLSGQAFQSDSPVKCNFLVYGSDGSAPSEYRYNFYAYGWAFGDSAPDLSTVGAYSYPDFAGLYVDIPIEPGKDLYLSTTVPWGTLFVSSNSAFGGRATVCMTNPNSSLRLDFSAYNTLSIAVMNDPEFTSFLDISLEYDSYVLGHLRGNVVSYSPVYAAEIGDSFSVSSSSIIESGLRFAFFGSFDYVSSIPTWKDDLSKYESNLLEVSQNLELLNSIANENYGKFPFENGEIIGDFDDGASVFKEILSASGGEYIIQYLKGMWGVHPYFPIMIAVVGTFAIVGFIVRKL